MRRLIIILPLLLIALTTVAVGRWDRNTLGPTVDTNAPAQEPQNDASVAQEQRQAIIASPLPSAYYRVTKKPFGIFVSPKKSPVNPERFTGYHTGVDFETGPSEQQFDLPVSAICTGNILAMRAVSGYGGVVVQACRIQEQDVTVVYGHLRLSSINGSVGESLERAQPFGVLGAGLTAETDKERKHLHLAIHKGTAINTAGYVSTASQLSDWIDAQGWLEP
ncbi:M23 family metallopeptidase [Candidatus Uhrbacteria bacterium]|nr:M23 family metallopeptidase [Candidatus Uhrbacteria bacterium]